MFIQTQGKNLRPGDRILLVDGYKTVKSIEATSVSTFKLTLATRYNKVRLLNGDSWFFVRREVWNPGEV